MKISVLEFNNCFCKFDKNKNQNNNKKISGIIKPFDAYVPFLHPLKTLGNDRFSDIFQGV